MGGGGEHFASFIFGLCCCCFFLSLFVDYTFNFCFLSRVWCNADISLSWGGCEAFVCAQPIYLPHCF